MRQYSDGGASGMRYKMWQIEKENIIIKNKSCMKCTSERSGESLEIVMWVGSWGSIEILFKISFALLAASLKRVWF